MLTDKQKTILIIILGLILAGVVIVLLGKALSPSQQASDPADLTYEFCSNEFENCNVTGTKVVRFGAAPDKYVYKEVTGSVRCDYQVLGDPAPGETKTCWRSTDAPPPVVGCPICPTCPVVDAGTPPPVDAGVPPVDASLPPPVDAGPPGPGHRPSASKGTGFYVANGKLYDGNNNEFIMRGNNRTHIDNTHLVNNKVSANTTRWLAYFIDDPDKTIHDMTRADQGGSIANHFVAIPGDWAQTCKDEDAVFEQIVSRWVQHAAKYQQIERYMILNIANEYSPATDEKWRDKYIDAVQRIRAAGWHGNIEVDGSGCGQNVSPIVKYGQAVLNADPEKNVHFSVHVYGSFYSEKYGQPKEWRSQDLEESFDALKATGLTIVLGEVGPGPLLGGGLGGPSPTKIPATAIVVEAEIRGFGWLLWSSDDNDLSGAQCTNDSFCMFYDTTSNDVSVSNQTDWGKEAIGLWDNYATKASIF